LFVFLICNLKNHCFQDEWVIHNRLFNAKLKKITLYFKMIMFKREENKFTALETIKYVYLVLFLSFKESVLLVEISF
jgi:hypothetical protein